LPHLAGDRPEASAQALAFVAADDDYTDIT
jgi:hypothetical protein